MNHLIDGDAGRHPFSPYYTGVETFISLKRCDVCECDIDEDLTATVREYNWTVCVGCVKSLDLKEEFAESTSFEFESILKQLKPIL